MPDRVERDLLIVRAGLNEQVAAGFLGDQLIAVKARQIDERGGAARGQPVAVLAVLREETRAEAEGDRQSAGAEAEHIGGIRGALIAGCVIRAIGVSRAGRISRTSRVGRRQRRGRLALRHAGRSVGPGTQQGDHVIAFLGREIEGGDIRVALLRRDDAALMQAVERLDRHGRIGGLRRRLAERGLGDAARAEACARRDRRTASLQKAAP